MSSEKPHGSIFRAIQRQNCRKRTRESLKPSAFKPQTGKCEISFYDSSLSVEEALADYNQYQSGECEHLLGMCLAELLVEDIEQIDGVLEVKYDDPNKPWHVSAVLCPESDTEDKNSIAAELVGLARGRDLIFPEETKP